MAPGFVPLKRVVWAIDPFGKSEPLQKAAVDLLAYLHHRCGVEVEPVHVFSPGELELIGDLLGTWSFHYVPKAEQELKDYVESLNLPWLAQPVLLVEEAASVKKSVGRLVDHASLTGADLIVSSSRGRTGLSRWFLGSFSESLILSGAYPLIVTGPKSRSEGEIKNILVPIDLGPQTRPTLNQAAGLALQIQARITLFHSLSNPVEPIVEGGTSLFGSVWPPMAPHFSQGARDHRDEVEGWAKLLRTEGLEVDVVVDDQSGDVAEEILETGRRVNAQMIVMAAESGPIVTAITGGVVRKVIRAASIPVYISTSGLAGAEIEPVTVGAA